MINLGILIGALSLGVYVKGIIVLSYLLIPAFFFLFECVRHDRKWQPPVAYFALILFFVLLSFTSPIMAQSLMGCFGVFLLSQFRRLTLREFVVKRLNYFVFDLPWHHVLGVVVPFLYAILFTRYLEGGVAMFDWFHPMYELSNGRSFQSGLFNVSDLSYAGKALKFHFLGSQIPMLLSWLLGGGIVESVGGYIIAFYMCWFVLLTYFLSKRVSIEVPFWVVFFFPLVGLKSLFVPPTPSVLLGGVMLMLSVLLLLDRKRWLSLVALGLLLLSKASFFLVLGGAVFLWDLRRRKLVRRLLWYVVLALVFIGLYWVFFKGAHGHIMWVHFPTTVLKYLQGDYGALSLLYLPFFAVFVWLYIRVSDDVRSLLVACSLSGFLGITLIMEVTSGDHLQFLKAVGAAGVLSLVLFVKGVRLPERLRFIEDKKTVVVMMMAIVFSVPITKRFVSFSLSPILNASYTKLDALEWLQTAPGKGVVAFSPHYQVPISIVGSGRENGAWFMRTSYERSALTTKQILVESVKWKGVSTMPDISNRVSDLLRLYIELVDLSEASKLRMSVFFSDTFGETAVVPHSRSDNFGKEWSWINLQHKIAFEIKRGLEETPVVKFDEARELLNQYSIRYILLEDGDQPTQALYDLARVVYKNETHTILEVL
jgi:hypothetical protein